MNRKKFLGFTLTEAILTLGIIGVISMITIPTLVTKYKSLGHIATLKKVYAELVENIALLETEKYQTTGIYKTSLDKQSKTVTKTAGAFLTTYFNVVRDCKLRSQPCFASKYKSINGTTATFSATTSSYTVLLTNGVAISIKPAVFDSDKNLTSPAVVYVDVNGVKGPNIGGRDLFTFNIYEDGSIDEVAPSKVKDGTAESARNTLFSDNCKSSTVGKGCFAKILNDNWKINY